MATDLEAFQDSLQSQGHAPLYVRKHATTIRTMFNRGVKAGWLPSGFRPFDSAESIKLPPRPLLESDLPTDLEVNALLALADPYMADIIRLYHATGARTHELIDARVERLPAQDPAFVLRASTSGARRSKSPCPGRSP